jgi:hypothetical protein
MQPVEPNVPKQIVEGYTELGNYIAGDMRKQGLVGITTNTTYDAWTPARAYSHYHGGVRILSETASARLASPITVKFDELRGGRGVDPKNADANFGPVWKGGEWKLRNITDYMTAGAFSLLNHAADNRERWLARFYEIGKEAVRPRKDGELQAWLLPYSRPWTKWNDPPKDTNRYHKVVEILKRGGVEISDIQEGNLIAIAQPYGNFAKSLLEKQVYPDLKDDKGNPIAPYDVTAHTLPLLLGFEPRQINGEYVVRKQPYVPDGFIFRIGPCVVKTPTRGLYKSSVPVMDEGWTRFIFDRQWCKDHASIDDRQIRGLRKKGNWKTIIFPDQSPNQILNGYAKGSMPDEYTGGVGKEGVENLKKFVEAGGTLVFLNRSSNFAIEQFNLPVKDITQGLNRRDFFIPGSILRTELDTTHPIAKGMPKESIAWFENSPAFELLSADSQTTPTAENPQSAIRSPQSIRVIARYPSDPKQILLSGWALGAEKIAGKAALIEVSMGKGKIVLFGFRPQYRGQSLATLPLLFNAISQ